MGLLVLQGLLLISHTTYSNMGDLALSSYVLTIYNEDNEPDVTSLPTALQNYVDSVQSYRDSVAPHALGECDSFCLAADIYQRWKLGEIT